MPMRPQYRNLGCAMTARYAIYFAPAQDSPWWTFGAGWLGRDEFADTPFLASESAHFETDERLAITLEPRRYGFHATLKAPFRLGKKHTHHHLIERVQALSEQLSACAIGPLQAQSLGKFVALLPSKTPAQVATVAQTCVLGLDDLRAPLTEEDLARRQISKLDARELELLHCYGYPYVLEKFRFHFSLTGPVDQPTRERVIQDVAQHVKQLNQHAPLVLDRLCVFRQATLGAPFKRIADAVLAI